MAKNYIVPEEGAPIKKVAVEKADPRLKTLATAANSNRYIKRAKTPSARVTGAIRVSSR